MEKIEEMKLYSQLKELRRLHYDARSKVRLSDSDLKRCSDYIDKIDERTKDGYDKRVHNGDRLDFYLRPKRIVSGIGSMSADPIRRKGYRL